jgi:hypothetical protein
MNTEQKWAAHELMSDSGNGADIIIGVAMRECDDKTFAVLTAAFPDKMQKAMESGRIRKKQAEETFDRARQMLADHPDLLVKLAARAENLLQRSAKRQGNVVT